MTGCSSPEELFRRTAPQLANAIDSTREYKAAFQTDMTKVDTTLCEITPADSRQKIMEISVNAMGSIKITPIDWNHKPLLVIWQTSDQNAAFVYVKLMDHGVLPSFPPTRPQSKDGASTADSGSPATSNLDVFSL